MLASSVFLAALWPVATPLKMVEELLGNLYPPAITQVLFTGMCVGVTKIADPVMWISLTVYKVPGAMRKLGGYTSSPIHVKEVLALGCWSYTSTHWRGGEAYI